MKYKLLKIDKITTVKERPYYIMTDNAKSNIKIDKKTNYAAYDSLSEIIQNQKITKALVLDNYFDTNYLAKTKKESINYPKNNNLG